MLRFFCVWNQCTGLFNIGKQTWTIALTTKSVPFSAIFHLYSDPPALNRRDLGRKQSDIGHVPPLYDSLAARFFGLPKLPDMHLL